MASSAQPPSTPASVSLAASVGSARSSVGRPPPGFNRAPPDANSSYSSSNPAASSSPAASSPPAAAAAVVATNAAAASPQNGASERGGRRRNRGRGGAVPSDSSIAPNEGGSSESSNQAPAAHNNNNNNAAAGGRGGGRGGRNRGRGNSSAIAVQNGLVGGDEKADDVPSSASSTTRRSGGGRGGGGNRGGGGARAASDVSRENSNSAANSIDNSDEAVRGRGGARRGGRGGGRGGNGGGQPAWLQQQLNQEQMFRNRGRGRGGRGGGGGGGGRGSGNRNNVMEVIVPDDSPSPPSSAPAVTAPAVPVPEPASRFTVDKDGAFTLVTLEPLSDGTAKKKKFNGVFSDAPIVEHIPVQSLASQMTDAELEEKKASDALEWFHADTATPVVHIEYDERTNELLDFIAELMDGSVPDLELTAQQASILRYLSIRSFEPVIDLLSKLQQEGESVSKESVAQFEKELNAIVEHQLEVEANCRDSQAVELEALQSIFGHVRELTMFQTYPLTLKLTVVLQEFDCNIELGFMLPACYPLEEPLIVNSFIPPPYQGLKIVVQEPTTSSSSSSMEESKQIEPQLKTIDELLQDLLVKKSRELLNSGDASVYECIEAARGFMDSHAHLLKTSLEQQQTQDQSQVAQRVLVNDGIAVFGRGRIEKLEYDAIKTVQEALNLNESTAKSKVIEFKWDVNKLLQDYASNSSSGSAPPAHASGPASSPGPVPRSSPKSSQASKVAAVVSNAKTGTEVLSMLRQTSGQARADSERYKLVEETYRKYVEDPTLTLSCSACFEDFQLREVAGHACGHVMCFLCWRRSLAVHLHQGQSNFKCIGYKCSIHIEEGLLFSLVSYDDYKRYRRFLQDSFIKLKGWKWCVNPRCNNVTSAEAGFEFATVACYCHALYCFTCGKEGHWPVSCSTAALYNTSKLVLDMRKQVESRIGRIIREDDVVKVDVKRCPKCGTHWERNGGCNHFKCGTCEHHFCWICTKDWALHGVSWFQCMFASEEKKSERLYFAFDAMLSGDLDQLYRYCERELIHYIAVVRIKRIIAEVEAMKEQRQTGSTVVKIVNQEFPPELPSLLAEIGHPLLSLIEPILAFIFEAHSILRACYIFATLNYKALDTSGPLKYDRRGIAAKKLLFDLNQMEYFVDVLDQTLIPIAGVRRLIRPVPVMNETMRDVRKFAKVFAASIQSFQENELSSINTEEATKAFFEAVDKTLAPLH